MVAKVSIIVVDYNAVQFIENCLASLCRLAYEDFEIIVVDNGSTDGSGDLVEKAAREFPFIKLISPGKNLGFGGGNNLGARHADGKYLVFLNPDTSVSSDLIQALIAPLEVDLQLGMTTARIMIMATPQLINTCGNDVHFTGIGYLRGWQASAEAFSHVEDVCSISGAAFAIPKDLYDELGGFDEAFFPAYVEDTDLSWRTRLAGYQIQYVPTAVVYHDYRSGFSPDKFLRLERNRYQMVLKTYRWKTLVLFMPALLLSDLVSWGYAFLHGPIFIRNKLSVYGWLISHFGRVMEARKSVQKLRKIPDRKLLQECTFRLAFEQAVNPPISTLANLTFNAVFYLLYRLYSAVIWW